MTARLLSTLLAFAALALARPLCAQEPAPDFAAVFKVLDARCLECHAQDDYEGGLILENHATLMKGGETGKAIEPGKSAESLLMKFVRGEVEKDGKKKIMPPGKRQKLDAAEIALLAKWIDAGAKPPVPGSEKPRVLVVAKIAPKVPPRNAVNALAFAPQAKLVAVGRFQTVELVSSETHAVVGRLEGARGNVNALAFSPDGTQLFAASGENALTGEVRQWDVAGRKLIRSMEGHRDTIYALALSPDGQTLATGSYDQQIKLWSTATGAELRTLRGHNGAVFDIAFRPDGKVLASASADRTVKLWDVATGQRRDTLSDSLKELHTVAWSADGRRVAAAGVDNRIRVWDVSADARETTNPLVWARFAHDAPILKIAWSADGATLLSAAQDDALKAWDAGEMKERLLFEKQPDWVSALAFADGGKTVVAGRQDGSLAFYDAQTGAKREPQAASAKAAAPKAPAKPVLERLAPRGIQRGGVALLRLVGSNLAGLRFVACADPAIRVEFSDGENANEALLTVHTPPTLKRGGYDISVVGTDGKHAGMVKLFVDDLVQTDTAQGDAMREGSFAFPASIWGELHQPGATARIPFDAAAGQTLVFDLAAKSLGAKADAVISLLDAEGRVLASNNEFDGTGDPFLAHTFAAAGRYTLAVRDAQFAGSREHFFRVSIGELPVVTGCFPLSVPANRESEVELAGFHLPAGRKVKVTAGAPGEMIVPLDPERFRARRSFNVVVSDLPAFSESEPNDTPAQATAVQAPASIAGRSGSAGDADFFKFDAKAGSVWAIETEAARRGSPMDTKIEVLHADGKPVARLLLQAVRDSAITFRPIDSASTDARVDNWTEMGLNQFIWFGGEVAKIFRMPEGPDSGFEFYATAGKRTAYFNTTATAHSLDEPCYVVEPHPPGTRLVSNGLPVFTLHYANDDDGDRKLGTDSRLLFTAPADGAYLVRVSDSRASGGERHAYRLVIREARPDFAVKLNATALTIPAGSGQAFTLAADRIDGFDGDITVTLENIPAGFHAPTPLVIQAGHQEALGSLSALPGAAADADWSKVRVTATAVIGGERRSREVNNFGAVKIGPEPKLFVALESVAPGDSMEKISPPTPLQPQTPAQPFEITIAPGEIIPAWVKIRRNGENGDLRFDVENLPHGVIVDNLGLNGITLLAGKGEGEIFLKAAPWVAEQDRLCFAVSRDAGKQTSLPVLLHVRKKEDVKTVSSK